MERESNDRAIACAARAVALITADTPLPIAALVRALPSRFDPGRQQKPI